MLFKKTFNLEISVHGIIKSTNYLYKFVPKHICRKHNVLVFTFSPTQGKSPGAKTHGMKADPLMYPWIKYERSLLNG